MDTQLMYKSYKDMADLKPGITKKNINELVNLYIDSRGTNDENIYMAAIILHYWAKINRYNQKSGLMASFEDAYEWVTDGILKACELKAWRDPENKLYNDPNAPDKCINRVIDSVRANWFQAMNRDTRKINMGIYSIDKFYEDYDGMESEEWVPINQSVSPGEENPAKEIIIGLFKSLNYEKAFILDIIVYDGGESEKQIVNTFKDKLNDTYLGQFSARYSIPYEEVVTAAKYIKDKNPRDLNNLVSMRIREIREQYNVKEWV